MTHPRLAAVLFAALALAACDGLLEPGEQAQEQLLFERYADRITRWDTADIYLVNADGTGARNLTGHLARYGSIRPSPDGRTVLFSSNRGDDDFHVWRMARDGTGLRQLRTEPGGSPRWSPDGNRIAITMHGPDGGHVYVMNPDGTSPVKVSGPAMQVGSACSNQSASVATNIALADWLPDGRIAFTRFYCGYGYRYFFVNPDGSGFEQTTIRLFEAHWSPDGKRVAVPRFEGGIWQVVVMNVDGSDARTLTAPGTQQGLPWVDWTRSAWSPDSKRLLVYAGSTAGGPQPECSFGGIPYAVNVDGSGAQRLMESCGGIFEGWSPSGEKVVFTLRPGEDPTDVHAVDADGTGRVNLTNSPGWEGEAQWLP